ncbi:lasso peptide biosynthesis B2 protein [Streptomyces millisiae]|uniref:Lasso peptide biosynthesis B2 protein n=1 Tax=Streptomyces millisiae TaxID=3075542 RepID=A0ABU2LXE0_9ACTN|nr:lasso peptide biosynthesis B2 protein [Streptomyces sp. DSM 44918]MDT0322271.1 lasso peptide biosynthesis B2 protein [Streptomyces sp. DSM 44918]
MSQVLNTPGERPGPLSRAAIHTVVLTARLVARLPPRRIRAFLNAARRGARAATHDEALVARRDVTATSTMCAGRYCLQRSLASALLCRLRGTWPTWCSGVRTPPFAAHAWIEAEGSPVGEPRDTVRYTPVIRVPPRERSRP